MNGETTVVETAATERPPTRKQILEKAAIERREHNPKEKAMFELFVPTAKERTPSKFVSDQWGNRILRPEPQMVDTELEPTETVSTELDPEPEPEIETAIEGDNPDGQS